MHDSTQSIFKSAKRFFSGTMLSRVTGLLRDIVMAFAFGTHASAAAFLEAFRFSHLLRRLFGEGALQSVFAPHFEQFRQEDSVRAGVFFRDLCASLAAVLSIIILAAMLLLGGWLAWGNLSPDNQEVLWLTFLMMPSLLFICLFGINAALLQCEKSYFTSSAAPIAFNLMWAAGAFYLKDMPQHSAMPWLAAFIILGCAAQWAVTLPQTMVLVKRLGQKNPLSLFSADVRLLAKPMALGMLGIAASQINNALDVIFARYADIEGPALLWYAIRLQQLPLALFGISLSGALLPPLARAAKSGDLAKFHLFFDYALKQSCSFMVLVTAGLLISGDRCIDLIYARGDFTAESTVGTTYCLWGYALGLIPMTLILLIAPAFYAQNNYRVPTYAAVISVIVNIALNSWLILILNLGPSSVAFATSFSAWVNLIILIAASKFSYLKVLRSMMQPTLYAAAAVGAVLAVDHWLSGNTALQITQGSIPSYSNSFIEKSLHLAVDMGFFGLALVGSYLVGSQKVEVRR